MAIIPGLEEQERSPFLRALSAPKPREVTELASLTSPSKDVSFESGGYRYSYRPESLTPSVIQPQTVDANAPAKIITTRRAQPGQTLSAPTTVSIGGRFFDVAGAPVGGARKILSPAVPASEIAQPVTISPTELPPTTGAPPMAGDVASPWRETFIPGVFEGQRSPQGARVFSNLQKDVGERGALASQYTLGEAGTTPGGSTYQFLPGESGGNRDWLRGGGMPSWEDRLAKYLSLGAPLSIASNLATNTLNDDVARANEATKIQQANRTFGLEELKGKAYADLTAAQADAARVDADIKQRAAEALKNQDYATYSALTGKSATDEDKNLQFETIETPNPDNPLMPLKKYYVRVPGGGGQMMEFNQYLKAQEAYAASKK